MENICLEGIVVSSLIYKEKSKIVYIYTKDGMVSYRALGSLNEKKGMLPLTTTMNRVSVIMTNKAFPRAIDYTLHDSYEYIKDDLKKTLFMQYILEIISKLPEDSPHERIYSLLKRVLELFKDYDGLMLTTLFMIKMTYSFGVAPILKKCVICNNPNTMYFSIRDGGALCGNHHKREVFNKDILDKIKEIYFIDIYNDSLDKIKGYDMIELFRIVNLYYSSHVDIYLKGASSLIF